MRKLVSVLIPAKNEEETLGRLLKDLNNEIRKSKKYRFEVLVLHAGSTDRTAAIAKKFKAKPIAEEGKLGKGAALITGFKHAKGEIILMMDADYSHKPEDMWRLLKKIEGGYGFVVASRSTGGSEEYTRIRTFGNMILTATFSILFGTNVTDVLNGYKAFRKEVAKNYQYQATGFDIEVEIFANAMRENLGIAEVPSHERKRAGGKMKSLAIIHGPAILWRIIKEGIKYRLGF